MSDQTLTPLRSKKIKRPSEATPKRRFSFSFADTSMKSEGNKNSPQFTRLLSPKNWRLSRIKSSERHAHDSTNSLPDKIQQSSFEIATLPAALDDSKSYTLRVYASDLHPDILYKTITITATTTAVDALQLLLKKYAVNKDDRDHSRFNLAEVNETSKGNYFRALKDDECPLQIQCNWVKASEWSFWLIRKEARDSPAYEFRPTRDKEFEIPIDVSYLDGKYSVVTISMSDDSTCAEVIEKVLSKFKLSKERCDGYCLWEMIGDGNQISGTPLMASEKVLANKKTILSGETTLFLRPQSNSDSRCASPADLDNIFGTNLSDSESPPCAWISNTPSLSQEDNEETSCVPWTSELCDELTSMVSLDQSQNTLKQPQIVHSFSEPYQLSESSKSDIGTDDPLGLPRQLTNPTITVTTIGSTGTSTDCSTESMADSHSQSNSTASRTLQINSSHSSTTEVDIVQEAKSPCPSNPVRVRIQYPCSLYQDSNYLPPKKLSSMIEEMIKDGMPRLMKKIVEETKLAYKKPTNIFNFDVLPQREDATPSYPIIEATNKEEPVNSVSTEQTTPDVAQTSYALSDLPNRSNSCQEPSSDGAKSSENEIDKTMADHCVVDQNILPMQKATTLPHPINDLKLYRSNSLISERRRMDILRNMSQSVKDRLRRHSSSAAAATSSTPSSLDRCPTSTNSSPMSATPTGSHCGSPTHHSVNIIISNTAAIKTQQPQQGEEPSVPAPKNKVRRWISFNYGDKTKSKAAKKYMKHLE